MTQRKLCQEGQEAFSVNLDQDTHLISTIICQKYKQKQRINAQNVINHHMTLNTSLTAPRTQPHSQVTTLSLWSQPHRAATFLGLDTQPREEQ